MATNTGDRLIPVPKSLGGGTITVFRCGGPRLGDCTTPGCTTRATTKCKYELRDGRRCDKPLCDRHTGTGEADGFCMPHARMVQKAKLFP